MPGSEVGRVMGLWLIRKRLCNVQWPERGKCRLSTKLDVIWQHQLIPFEPFFHLPPSTYSPPLLSPTTNTQIHIMRTAGSSHVILS